MSHNQAHCIHSIIAMTFDTLQGLSQSKIEGGDGGGGGEGVAPVSGNLIILQVCNFLILS